MGQQDELTRVKTGSVTEGHEKEQGKRTCQYLMLGQAIA